MAPFRKKNRKAGRLHGGKEHLGPGSANRARPTGLSQPGVQRLEPACDLGFKYKSLVAFIAQIFVRAKETSNPACCLAVLPLAPGAACTKMTPLLLKVSVWKTADLIADRQVNLDLGLWPI